MSYRPDRIPEQLETALRDLFGGIDHVNVERVRWSMMAARGRHPVAITDESYCVVVHVRCWSPTLHQCVIQYEADLAAMAEAMPTRELRIKALSDIQRNDAIGVATLITLALDAFQYDAEDQRDRVVHARRLGIHRPKRMRSPGAVSDGQRIAVGHLMIDRSAASTLRDLCGDGGDDPCPRRTIEHAVACAHQMASLDSEASVPASDIERVSINSHLHGPTVDITVTVSPVCRITGDVLVLESSLPETVLAACAGRPLADVVDAGVHLSGRTIVSARERVGTTRITLGPDHVRVDEAFPPRRGTRSR